MSGLPKSRSAAKLVGSAYYHTGRPCCWGHIARRATANGSCTKCARIRAAASTHRARRKIWYDNYMSDRANRRKKNISRNRWRNAKRQSDLEWKRRESQRKLNSKRRRLNRDPEFRRKVNRLNAARFRKRYQSDPVFRLSRIISTGVTIALKSLGEKKGGRSWQDFVSFTIPQLIKHIERRLLAGMTWENYGPVWHIDHIKPISKCKSVAEAWKLSNLQPLFAADNIRKKDQYPYQPPN